MTQQKQFLDVIDRDEAARRFESAVDLAPLDAEEIAVAESHGRILALDVISTCNVPSFDRSNFDGYAIRAEDTIGATEETPRRVELSTQRISTGESADVVLQAGQAISIATGAMIPRGADAIVMVEHTRIDEDGRLAIERAVSPGFGLSFAGSDISVGQTVLRCGDLLTSRETGVLSAIGLTAVRVVRKPKVAVISTGDEIIAPGEAMRPGMVYDSNARIIADAVTEAGGEPIEMGIAIDQLEDLRSRLSSALQQADVVLLSGGTSKGDGDLSYRVVAEYSDPGIVAHGVALKPGKPICLAVTGGKPLVVLPGFPTSAIFTFHEFVAPVLRSLAGRTRCDSATIPARLATPVNSEIGRKEYLLVGLMHRMSGSELVAYPIGKGSGSVTTFSQSDGFIAIDRYTEMLDADSIVDVQLIGETLRVADLTVIGSHCVGLDFLLSQMQQRGFTTRFFAVGSSAGLQAALRGDCDLAGIHLFHEQEQIYNTPFLNDTLRLIPGYQRMQSLVLRAADLDSSEFDSRQFARDETAVEAALQKIRQLTTDANRQMVNRNRGSGTRILIDRLLKQIAGPADQPPKPGGYAMQPGNHHAVVTAIAQRRADWGIAIRSVAEQSAQQTGGRAILATIPVENEQYDFITPASRADRPAVQAITALLADPQVRQQLCKLDCIIR